MSVLNNLNYIKQVYTIPCVGAGLWVFIETGVTAAGLALLEFASFGCRDLYQLRAGKLPFCGRQISPGFKKAWLGDDITKATKIFKALDPIEKGLFKWMLADIGTGFIANWHSLLYQTANCYQDANVASVAGDNAIGAGIGPGAPFRIAYRVAGGSGWKPYFYGFGFQVPRDWYWQCDFSYKVKPYFPGRQPGVNVWLKESHSLVEPEDKCTYDPSAWFGPQYAACRKAGRASASRPFSNYEFFGEMDDWGFPNGGSLMLRISKLPLLETHTSVLSCLKYQSGFLPGVDAINQEIPVPFFPGGEFVNAATGILLSKAGLKN